MEQPHQFLDWLQTKVADLKINMLIPVTEISSQLILMYRHRFSDCIIPYADLITVTALANKRNLVDLARKIGIPVPETISLKEGQAALDLPINQFPVVLKPELSRVWLGNQWLNTSVHIVHNANELKLLVNQHRYLRDFPVMVQEYIPGSGAGLFTIFDHGKAVAYFTHRRLREKPPSGGVSVLSQSVELNTELVNYSQKLLEMVNWHGVAMVEYRIATDGTPYLMEVNTRFWGSLQLAIDSGVDFPMLLLQIATNSHNHGQTQDNYKTGVVMRWLLGDLDRLYIILKDKKVSLRLKVHETLAFFTPKSGTRYEVNRFDDLAPAWFEFKQYIKALL